MSVSFVDHKLAARLEATQAWRAVHYANASCRQSHGTDAEIITVAGAPVIYGGAGLPVNRAIGVGMQGAVSADDLDTIEAFYSERRADTLIDLCPLADASLLHHLHSRGYTNHGYVVRGWMSMLVLELPANTDSANTDSAIATYPDATYTDATHTDATNPALHVARATRDQADLWLATSARGFDESDQVSASTLNVLTPNFYAENAHCYFVWQGPTPIATGGMYLHENVVELGGTSTLPAYRQQGAQRALIQQRLHDAYAQGCDLAVVLTTPGSASQRNMQRRGFELAYTRAIYLRPFAA